MTNKNGLVSSWLEQNNRRERKKGIGHCYSTDSLGAQTILSLDVMMSGMTHMILI